MFISPQDVDLYTCFDSRKLKTAEVLKESYESNAETLDPPRGHVFTCESHPLSCRN